MKSEKTFELTFQPPDIIAALSAARSEGLLCGACTEKIETLDQMSQSDFCTACQATVNSQLSLILARRMKEVLADMGLPSDAVEITDQA